MNPVSQKDKPSNSKRTVAVIGTVGIPANYGGFETLTEHLVKHLATDVNFIVYCSSVNYAVKQKYYNGARLVYFPISANGKWSIVYDSLCIMHSLFVADTLLILGVGGAFLLPLVKVFTRKRILTNIDGLEWKRNKWGRLAKAYLYIQEYIAVKCSHTIVADNLGIQKYVRNKYKIDSSLIAYGGSHAFHSKISSDTIERFEIKFPYAFTVCRIEPENNVHVILEAFSRTDQNLVFIGNWEASEYGRTLKKKYKKAANINIIDPVYDQSLLNEMRSNCKLYVHGHSAGGTNPSLVEAMWLGLPIFAWNVSYNRHTTQNVAFFFRSEESLLELLRTKSDAEIDMLKKLIQQTAFAEYNWEKITQSYKSLF